MRPCSLAPFVAAFASSIPASALAEDGAAGRLRGDVAISGEAGAGTAAGDAGGTAQARALYVATAGLYGAASFPFSETADWRASTGVEVRPLFLPRFLLNLERNRDVLDVTLDSLAFGMGVAFARSTSPALELTGGFEVPLLGEYEGPFIGARLSYVVSHERQLGDGGASTSAFLTLGFRGVFGAHVVDAGDRVVR